MKSTNGRVGVYGIYCIPLGRWYIGMGDTKARIRQHKAKLRGGRHELPRLQCDWNEHGEGKFAFVTFDNLGVSAWSYEIELIQSLDTLEHRNGYNKAIGSIWGPEAKIRNVEDKYVQYGKFHRLPGIHKDSRMASKYMETFYFDPTSR